MPVFDASALNDNDEALAFLRAVLALPEGNTRLQRQVGGSPLATSDAQHPNRPQSSGIPLILGVAVSIMTAMQ